MTSREAPQGFPDGLLRHYSRTLKKLRPGDRGEISLEPWMGTRSSRHRLKAAAHEAGLDLDFLKSPDPRRLVFEAKPLPPDKPPPSTPIGPPPPPKKPRSRASPRTYIFDLTPYEELLSSAKPDDVFELDLGTASPDVVKYRMSLVAKKKNFRLEFAGPKRKKLTVIVHDRSWRKPRPR